MTTFEWAIVILLGLALLPWVGSWLIAVLVMAFMSLLGVGVLLLGLVVAMIDEIRAARWRAKWARLKRRELNKSS